MGIRYLGLFTPKDEREASLEERGTETNSSNAFFGTRLSARVVLWCSLHKLSLQAALRHGPIASLRRARLSLDTVSSFFL